MNIADITVTSLETITAFDVLTGDYLWTLDELQNASIQNSEEKTDITGKQGRKITSLKTNKTVTVSGDNGLVSGGLLATQTGGTFENKTTEVLWIDYLTVASSAATTTYTAVGTEGAEIEAIYVKVDGIARTVLTQSDSTGEDTFTYDPTSKALAFDASIEDGTEIVVYYKRQINANVLENESDVYSGKAMLYIDALGEDTCSNVYRIQFYIPKADFSGEFSIEMGDSQTVHSFEAEALSGGCVAGNTSLLWTYTIFGVDEEDAA